MSDAYDNHRRTDEHGTDDHEAASSAPDITVDAHGRHLYQASVVEQIGSVSAAELEVDRSTHDRLPAAGQSLWWPDRNAQVVQATNVSPRQAADFLRSRSCHAEGELRIEVVTEQASNEFDVLAQLHMRPTGWRGVKLRIYPTPSGNLSVIEMLPRRAWMPQTTRYLAAGVPAITRLTDQIEAAHS